MVLVTHSAEAAAAADRVLELRDGRVVHDSRVRAHVVPAALDDLLAAHRSGERNLGHALWTLLTLEVFLRREEW